MQNDDSDDDEVDKCVYVDRKYVWEYGSLEVWCLYVSVYVLSFCP